LTWTASLDTARLHHRARAAAVPALGYRIAQWLFAAIVGVHPEFKQAMLVEQLGRDFPIDGS